MELTNAFYEAVTLGNVRSVRIMMKDSLLIDPVYDFLKYYEGIEEDKKDDEMILMSKKCGLYGLENILFGGEL